MRVVLDTNIFVSMALGGTVGQINSAWRTEKFTLIVTNEIVAEYLVVLQRPRLHLAPRTIALILNRIDRKAEFVTSTESISLIEADPTDNKFIEAALAGHAEYIVSGDKHLLEHKDFRAIRILTARAFLNLLKTH